MFLSCADPFLRIPGPQRARLGAIVVRIEFERLGEGLLASSYCANLINAKPRSYWMAASSGFRRMAWRYSLTASRRDGALLRLAEIVVSLSASLFSLTLSIFCKLQLPSCRLPRPPVLYQARRKLDQAEMSLSKFGIQLQSLLKRFGSLGVFVVSIEDLPSPGRPAPACDHPQ